MKYLQNQWFVEVVEKSDKSENSGASAVPKKQDWGRKNDLNTRNK
jgi:hypothetical protein